MARDAAGVSRVKEGDGAGARTGHHAADGADRSREQAHARVRRISAAPLDAEHDRDGNISNSCLIPRRLLPAAVNAQAVDN